MERRAIVVRGIVQGVGFRPFVHELAVRLGLRGFVKNHGGAVEIEVEGIAAVLDGFLESLARGAPPLARIEDVRWQSIPGLEEAAFRIVPSDAGSIEGSSIAADAAVCRECLAELFDPGDRRYRYPFLNCTHCGPRLTIIRGAPYDRERTTMASFAMCDACRAEYDDPRDRRFHAQPIACPRCGPKLELREADGSPIATEHPLRDFAERVGNGAIGALKGIGGFHLVCDAGNDTAVRELRARKHRDEQPFALMLPDLEAAGRLCELGDEEARLLQSRQAPIVLLRKKAGATAVSEGVAPGNPNLGVMLPYSPLHHLLVRELEGRPLVMTSGNRTSEPIAYENDDALSRLNGIADLFLLHDRAIHVRCDDSVTRVVAGTELPLRRSRGAAPQSLPLPRECPAALLAVGGHLKGAFAVASGRQAILSHHLGDLEHFDAYCAFERDVALYRALFDVAPQRIVHDLHPDYATTRWAREVAEAEGIPRLAVQHHHAHIASCMAEHRLDEPVIGVAFDGTGYGLDEETGDATVWGGEFLVGDYRAMRRTARLRHVGMPGGESAIREPWRMALAHLIDAGCGLSLLERRIPADAIRTTGTMIERRINLPATSSIGRLFDAAASIAGIRDRVTYEGQAAMQWEWLATDAGEARGAYPFTIEPPSAGRDAAPDVIDTRPIIRALAEDAVRGIEPRRMARRFHTTIVDVIETACLRIRDRTGLGVVVLSGGVFANAILLREAVPRLEAHGFRVYRHRLVPPNDGGLCLGQAAIAAAGGQVDRG